MGGVQVHARSVIKMPLAVISSQSIHLRVIEVLDLLILLRVLLYDFTLGLFRSTLLSLFFDLLFDDLVQAR